MRYYLDTCIWIDYFEDRKDRFRPLGEWAHAFIRKAIDEASEILVSSLVVDELLAVYTDDQIKDILSIVPDELLVHVDVPAHLLSEANHIKYEKNIPQPDAIHALLAKEHYATLITRDNHFDALRQDFEILRPEDLL